MVYFIIGYCVGHAVVGVWWFLVAPYFERRRHRRTIKQLEDWDAKLLLDIEAMEAEVYQTQTLREQQGISEDVWDSEPDMD